MNQLLTPIAHGLETLEGQNTTCSDVFHIYIGIAVNFVTMFLDRGESCSTFFITRPTLVSNTITDIEHLDSPIYEYHTAIFNVFD